MQQEHSPTINTKWGVISAHYVLTPHSWELVKNVRAFREGNQGFIIDTKTS